MAIGPRPAASETIRKRRSNLVTSEIPGPGTWWDVATDPGPAFSCTQAGDR